VTLLPAINPAAQNDPTGHAVWADLKITLLDMDPATAAANTYGGDYMAGGAGDDMIFGQLGNDVIQGDGSIDARYTDLTGTYRVGDAAPGGGLVASFDGVGDGNDYIEGNGGTDTIFGNQGQDDIIGGQLRHVQPRWFRKPPHRRSPT